jgi:hypothetical protein
MMRKISAMILLVFFAFAQGYTAEKPGNLVKRAAEIHHAVVTIDSHTDTPLRMVQKGFDISVKHDAPQRIYKN